VRGFFRKIAELPGWILAINARSNAHDLTVMWHNGRAKISPLLGLVKIYREEAPVCVSVSWSFKQYIYIYIYIERDTIYVSVSWAATHIINLRFSYLIHVDCSLKFKNEFHSEMRQLINKSKCNGDSICVWKLLRLDRHMSKLA
jgi:hypothetical protein